MNDSESVREPAGGRGRASLVVELLKSSQMRLGFRWFRCCTSNLNSHSFADFEFGGWQVEKKFGLPKPLAQQSAGRRKTAQAYAQRI